MLGLLSYKSLGQMQQSRELLQQSLAAVPLRSPFRIYVEKSVAYLETMILHCRSIRLAAQSPGTLMAVNFSPTTIVGRPRNRQRVANGTQPALEAGRAPCLSWVKNGPDGPETPFPVCPEERTSSEPVGMSQS